MSDASFLSSLESSPLMGQVMGMMQMQLMSAANGREVSWLPLLFMFLPMLPKLIIWLIKRLTSVEKKVETLNTAKKVTIFMIKEELGKSREIDDVYASVYWYVTTELDLGDQRSVVVHGRRSKKKDVIVTDIQKRALDDSQFSPCLGSARLNRT